jgi:hypothetical protein
MERSAWHASDVREVTDRVDGGKLYNVRAILADFCGLKVIGDNAGKTDVLVLSRAGEGLPDADHWYADRQPDAAVMEHKGRGARVKR